MTHSTAGAAMSGHGQAMLVAVLVALDGGLCSVFRPVQAALLPWLHGSHPGRLRPLPAAAAPAQRRRRTGPRTTKASR